MSTKTKIMAFVSLASLTMVLLMVGVWALKTVNFTVGGNLSYIAPGIEATISKGTMSNGVWVNANDATTKMPLTQITRTDTAETLTTKFSYWQDLNLNFNEAGDDVTITFSITNDMEKYALAINVTTSYATADNATISINTSSAELAPDASQEFVITLAVTEKTQNATLSAFAIVFHMEMVELVVVPVEDVSYLTFTYNNTTMEATLKACNTLAISVEVPSRILYNEKTYVVTTMYDALPASSGVFYGSKSLTTVVLPNTIKNIGIRAFRDCMSLTSITIPDSVTIIGDFAFDGCTGLSSITIPDSVTSIIGNPFDSCSGLETIVVESGNTVYNSNNNCNAIIETSTNTLITGCKKTVIPSTVKTIGDSAFRGCTGLTSITIPDSVTRLGNFSFRDCESLTSITIPDGVTSIGSSAFSGCGNLTYKTYSNAKYLGNSTNPYVVLVKATSESITSCTINSNCKIIYDNAFEWCEDLKSITIPNGVKDIGTAAFQYCYSLTSITIPDSVSSIQGYAFEECTSLKTVTIKATTPPAGESGLFGLCDALTTIYVPTASVDAYKSAEYWSDYADYIKAGSF